MQVWRNLSLPPPLPLPLPPPVLTPTMYTSVEYAMVVQADGAHKVCLATNDCPPLRVDLCECVIGFSYWAFKCCTSSAANMIL